MIANYLKIAWRNILRHKGYAFITVFGFAVGLACCLFILFYTLDELSYDRAVPGVERTYRVRIRGVLNNNTFNGANSCAPMAEAIRREIPEVEAATRIRFTGFPVLRYRDKCFSEERFFNVDPSFFGMFGVKLLQGDPRTALARPNQLVLTASMAIKYFAHESPLGKTVNADKRRDYVVVGVIPDAPRNTHFHYDFLASLSTLEDSRSPVWISNNYWTYIRLRPGASPQRVDDKLYALTVKFAAPQVQQAVGISWDELLKRGAEYRYGLQPLLDIHLRSNLDGEIEPNGDIDYVTIFSLVAVGIFLIACINFVNLATARSATRAREIGLRKVLGSERIRLVRQFLAEAFYLSFLAMLLAMLLVILLRPLFEQVAGKSFDWSILSRPLTLALVTLMFIIGGFLAGLYPAIHLSSFQPVSVLKGEKSSLRRNRGLRNFLVVFQFAISIFVVFCTLVVYRQMNFVRHKRLGFAREQVVLIPKADDLGTQVWTFKQELLGLPGVAGATDSTNLMGDGFGNSVFMLEGAPGNDQLLLWNMVTDADFARVYGLEMKAGRYFEKGREADAQGAVINEVAAEAVLRMGLSDPVGKQLIMPTEKPRSFTILGVVRNFHFESLHYPIRPLVLFNFDAKGFGRFLSLRLKAADIPATLDAIGRTWKRFANNQAFEYRFFDDQFARVFLAEEKTGQLFLSFAMLAILIACLGLFGLAAFIAEQRRKEIGVRKVLGAAVSGIVVRLSREFLKWVLLANLIAWPLAYVFMKNWLDDFAYRASIGVSIFVFSGLLALMVALLTASFQVLRAARANPIDSLRYE